MQFPEEPNSETTRLHRTLDEPIPEWSEEATQAAPNNVEAWLYRAALAETDTQRLSYLNKALSIAPEHIKARYDLYETLSLYLRRDPFLRYFEENESSYRVLVGQERVVIVPKDRVAQPHSHEPSLLAPVFRWLGYALVGLPLAGLLTLVCAPIAAVLAWRASQQRLDAQTRGRTERALLYAGILWMIAIPLSVLFLLHLLL